MRENLAAAGFQINAVASFHQSDDFVVARISSKSIAMAVEEIGARDDCDGVFVSCTSLRTLPIIARAEVRLSKPVISSNQALAWHLMRLTGLDECPNDCGQLLRRQLPGAASR
jgi:maleate isomerase